MKTRTLDLLSMWTAQPPTLALTRECTMPQNNTSSQHFCSAEARTSKSSENKLYFDLVWQRLRNICNKDGKIFAKGVVDFLSDGQGLTKKYFSIIFFYDIWVSNLNDFMNLNQQNETVFILISPKNILWLLCARSSVRGFIGGKQTHFIACSDKDKQPIFEHFWIYF